jgi:parvulin-like peptidyl-prolyl isomerase
MLAAGVMIAAASAVYAETGAGTAPETRADSVVGTSAPPVTPFAVIGADSISRQEFQAALHEGMRRTFFHGAPEPEQLAAYRRGVAQRLIDRVLLRQEIKRRRLVADAAAVDAGLLKIEQRLTANPEWQADRERALPLLRARLEEENTLAQLEAQARQVAEPDAVAIRKYYQDHPEQFTTPERVRVSLILLKVEPSAPVQAWQAAEQEAIQLVGKLRGGADFAALARLHSADTSAAKGGDLGYIHRGMLAAEAQQALDKMVAVGEVSPPVMLLQGVAVLRLDERVVPVLNALGAAAPRVRELLMREQADAAWKGLLEGLRARTPIIINDPN